MSEPDFAATCMGCSWGCDSTGTEFGLQKIESLSGSHFEACKASDCVQIYEIVITDDGSEREVIGRINHDGLDVDRSSRVTA